eukprot:5930466-Prymnesium_polylepis.1
MFSTTIFFVGFTRTTPTPAAQWPALRTVARATVLAQDTGKFVRHSELSPGCAPLGVLCAGFDGEQLEMIAGVFAASGSSDGHSVVPLERHPP